MRIKKLNVKALNKKNKKKETLKGRTKLAKIPWVKRSPKYSSYPYLITISFFKRNIFLTAADFQGRIKVWMSTGQLGFKGGDKTHYLSLITMGHAFFKKLSKFQKISAFLKLKNYSPRWKAIKKVLKTRRKRKQSNIHFLGLLTELHISFNGCRKKHSPRKRSRRHHRRPKKIKLDYSLIEKEKKSLAIKQNNQPITQTNRRKSLGR